MSNYAYGKLLPDLRADCLTDPDNDTLLEEFLFRILIHPEKNELLRKHKDVLRIDSTSKPFKSWINSAEKRADVWFAKSGTDEMLCRLLLVDNRNTRGACVTVRIKNNPLSLTDSSFGAVFLSCYRTAWELSSKDYESFQREHLPLYNDIEILGSDKHIHNGCTLVDGSSAFLSIFIPLAAMARKQTISPYVGFLGSYTPSTGLVEGVSNSDIHLKLQAAYDYGLTTLFLHKDNYTYAAECRQPGIELKFYEQDRPQGVAEEILSAMTGFPFKSMYSSHVFYSIKESLDSVSDTLESCRTDVQSRERSKLTGTKLSKCRKKLEALKQNGTQMHTECLLLLYAHHNNAAEYEEARLVGKTLSEFPPDNPTQSLRAKCYQAVWYQDLFLPEKAEEVLRKAICFYQKARDCARDDDYETAYNEVRRTRAQNHAFLGVPEKAYRELNEIGRLANGSTDGRYCNYLTHAICDCENQIAWNELKDERTLFRSPAITDDHHSIYDVHAHLKGVLVFESLDNCRSILESLESSPFKREAPDSTGDPYTGIVLRCIGLIHERLFNANGHIADLDQALSFYRQSLDVFSRTQSIMSRVQRSISWAHIAIAEKEPAHSMRMIECLKKLLSERSDLSINGKLWEQISMIVRLPSSPTLDECAGMIILLKRFQWW